MGLVPTVETPLTLDGLIDATISGYTHLMGEKPPDAAAAVATAQAAIETSNGARMRNNNPGNRKKPREWDGDWCAYPFCDEILAPRVAARAKLLGPCEEALWNGGPNYHVILYPPHPWNMFVSWDTVEEGFSDWLGLLALADRYRFAWHRLFIGDAAAFVHELHLAGYMTANEDTYKRAVVSISTKILPTCRSRLSGDAHILTDDERSHVSDFVALTLANTIWMPERHGELVA